jgi:hypothetical protein
MLLVQSGMSFLDGIRWKEQQKNEKNKIIDT